MTEFQLKEFLDANKVEIQDAVKAKAIATMLEEYRWNINSQISEAVNKFIAEEIMPAVMAELTQHKAAIIENVLKGFASIGDELAKSLTVVAAKKLSTDWGVRGVAKELFGS